jgi:hypothetical protein
MLSGVYRWLIVRAVEERRPLPAWVARRIARSASLRRFRARVARVDSLLAEGVAGAAQAPPESLRRRTMETLHAGGMGPLAPGRIPWMRPVLAALALVVVAVATGAVLTLRWGVGPGAPGPQGAHEGGAESRDSMQTRIIPSLIGASAAVQATVEEPLMNEARLLVQDTQRAAAEVLGRLPFSGSSGW